MKRKVENIISDCVIYELTISEATDRIIDIIEAIQKQAFEAGYKEGFHDGDHGYASDYYLSFSLWKEEA